MRTNDLFESAIEATKVPVALQRNERQGALMPYYRSFAGGMLLGLATAGIAPAPAAANADHHLWPGKVQSDQALAGAIRNNAVSVKELQEKLGFPAMRTRFKTIINSEERIPHVSKDGEYYYNFWRDPQHVRGI